MIDIIYTLKFKDQIKCLKDLVSQSNPTNMSTWHLTDLNNPTNSRNQHDKCDKTLRKSSYSFSYTRGAKVGF